MGSTTHHRDSLDGYLILVVSHPSLANFALHHGFFLTDSIERRAIARTLKNG